MVIGISIRAFYILLPRVVTILFFCPKWKEFSCGVQPGIMHMTPAKVGACIISLQQALLKRSCIVIVLRAQYGANCSVFTPQHYHTKKSVPLLRSIVRSVVQTCLTQHCRLYNECSFSESQCLLCIVADSTQERQRSLHYHLHTIPTGFLTFHLSYDRRACHYRSLEGWMGSGLHDTRLFTSRKVKLRRNFASMPAMVSFDQHVAVQIPKFWYYATTHCTTFCAERNDCVHPAYFSFCTSVLHAQYDYSTGTFYFGT